MSEGWIWKLVFLVPFGPVYAQVMRKADGSFRLRRILSLEKTPPGSPQPWSIGKIELFTLAASDAEVHVVAHDAIKWMADALPGNTEMLDEAFGAVKVARPGDVPAEAVNRFRLLNGDGGK